MGDCHSPLLLQNEKQFSQSIHRLRMYVAVPVCMCQIARIKLSVDSFVRKWHFYLTFCPIIALFFACVLIDGWRKVVMFHIQMFMWLWSKHLPNNHHNDTVCNSNIHGSNEYMRLNIICTQNTHAPRAHTSMRMVPLANNTMETKCYILQHTSTMLHEMFPFAFVLLKKNETEHTHREREEKMS